ncbi:Cell division cycle protein 48 [Phytophthora citrophthora]|uniref:Cell division cycle protein 48 n=1 Tax=Phytophthora citrophthora TaxID=4793 RepID=A0AAD9GPB3_9STRA|nr:Cell division cycle protein 48 [Phytophthora citrophthora]
MLVLVARRERPSTQAVLGSFRRPKAVKVGHMEDERAALRELILLPVAHPKLRSELGVDFPKGVLLRGPPGVGKTLLVRSVVHECRQVEDDSGGTLALKLQVINGSEIMTSGHGDAEQALRDTFEIAVTHTCSARHAANVIFIDELNTLCPKRESAGGGASSSHSQIVAQLLTLLNGVEGGISRGNVVVAAATTLPNSIDPALRRPGRFDREIFVAPPSTALKKKIFNIYLNQAPYALSSGTPDEVKRQCDAFVDELAAKAVGFVDADIAALCREAVMVASTRHLVAMSRDQDLQQWTSLARKPCGYYPLAKDGERLLDQEYVSFLLGSEGKSKITVVPPTEEKTQAFEVTMEDFDQVMQTVVPSALRGASGFTYEQLLWKHFERQSWDSIGGQGETKLALQQALKWSHRPSLD